MSNVERIQELRKQEDGCAARIFSIQRKLAAGSTAVDQDDLRRWKDEMSTVQSELVELGEAPTNAA